ncbi:MAG: DUF4177 domain-containing protein [Rhodobacteraceae bacterium]|nr:DUF4177 domain-containing protein [Paracoccaceae bacterium]
MPGYEYKVVPAPTKGQKAKGVKTPEGRFAHALQGVLNVEGGAGWEYLRAELLPSEERSGLTGSTTNWRNVLVFRREIAVEASQTDRAPESVRAVPRVHLHPSESAAEQVGKIRKAENLATVSGMFAAQQSHDGEGSSEDGASSASDEGPVERS